MNRTKIYTKKNKGGFAFFEKKALPYFDCTLEHGKVPFEGVQACACAYGKGAVVGRVPKRKTISHRQIKPFEPVEKHFFERKRALWV